MTDRDAGALVLALLDRRALDATICPSEIARALASDEQAVPSPHTWRKRMPEVHAAVDRLLAAGRIRLSWKGQQPAKRDGPYRIGRIAPAD